MAEMTVKAQVEDGDNSRQFARVVIGDVMVVVYLHTTEEGTDYVVVDVDTSSTLPTKVVVDDLTFFGTDL
jgi:hypothetical protein